MPDNITFNTIPTDWLIPGAWVEIDPSRAVRGLPNMSRRVLLLGQRLSTGSVAEGVLVRVTRKEDGVNYFGRGSMLAQMIPAALKVHPTADLWALALDDLGAGAAAAGSITITGSPTEAGTLNLMIGGTQVKVGIAAADTPTAIAAAIVAAIAANPDLAVSATSALGVVTLAAKHKGAEGNGIDVRLNYYTGEFTPKGMAVAIVAMSGGTGNPDALEAISAMSTGAFYTIAMPWTDVANVAAMESELESRWGGLDMRAGHSFGFKAGTFAELAAYGAARNSKQTTFPGLKKSPTLPWVAAAQFAARCEQSGADDPALPFHNLTLPDVLAPAEADRFTDSERNLLLHDGISTIKFDASGMAMIEQVFTTYQTNAFGMEDRAMRKLNTKWTADYCRSYFRFKVASTFPRHKLAGDDVLGKIAPGQKIATPRLIENVLIAAAGDLVRVGLIEDIEQFKRDLIVLRSEADEDRVNSIIPPNLVNQFEVFAAAIQYIL
jgi:phage tail sheath gpL-like